MILLNIYYELGEYKFEWDSEKAEINKKKHKVSFETAARVFLDENNFDTYDENHSDFEDRFKIIGRVGEILVVIYTERDIMNSFIKKIPPLTEEQIAEIKELSKMSYDEIDFSDIPPTTKEEFERMKENRRRRKNLKIAS